MPLRGIVQVFEAIPDRIEVSGHEPTWQVTGGSFESVVAFARRAFDDPVVVARQDRGRWWPRVTLTVTKDPGLAADAPPLEVLADPAPSPDPAPEPEPVPDPEPIPEPRPEAATGVLTEPQRVRLEDMFAYQEELRVASARHRVPRQRHRRWPRHPRREQSSLLSPGLTEGKCSVPIGISRTYRALPSLCKVTCTRGLDTPPTMPTLARSHP